MKSGAKKTDGRKRTEDKDVEYNEICIKICDELAVSDKGLHRICESFKISPRTFYEWVHKDEKNENRYVRARDEQADLLADQIIEIADDKSNDTIQVKKEGRIVEVENTEWTRRSQLRVDARKWIAAKLKPKKYSDKLDIQSTIKVEQPLFPDNGVDTGK